MTKRTVFIGAALVALAAVTIGRESILGSSPAPSVEAKVERGRYLVNTSGCHDCHTPWHMGPEGPEPDMSRALSGHPEGLDVGPVPALGGGVWEVAVAGTNTAYAGPWGVSFTANLTPDENTGIGIWTEDIFINTIRSGRHWGVSRPILPPMPWKVYSQMTDEDLASIFAYLHSIEPIHNRVPEPLPPAVSAAVPAG